MGSQFRLVVSCTHNFRELMYRALSFDVADCAVLFAQYELPLRSKVKTNMYSFRRQELTLFVLLRVQYGFPGRRSHCRHHLHRLHAVRIILYRAGTNLKLAEGYICHIVPRGPWSGWMKLWEAECTRSPLGVRRQRGPRHAHPGRTRGQERDGSRGVGRTANPGRPGPAKIISVAISRQKYRTSQERCYQRLLIVGQGRSQQARPRDEKSARDEWIHVDNWAMGKKITQSIR